MNPITRLSEAQKQLRITREDHLEGELAADVLKRCEETIDVVKRCLDSELAICPVCEQVGIKSRIDAGLCCQAAGGVQIE